MREFAGLLNGFQEELLIRWGAENRPPSSSSVQVEGKSLTRLERVNWA